MFTQNYRPRRVNRFMGFGQTAEQTAVLEAARAEYNRLMNLGQLTVEATARLMAAEMAVLPGMAQPTVTIPTGEIIYPSLIEPGGQYVPPPTEEYHSPYETYLPSTGEIISGQVVTPGILPPPEIPPPIIPSMSPQQRVAYYISQFGSPEAYAAEINRKTNAGIAIDDPEAARAMQSMYPELFVFITTGEFEDWIHIKLGGTPQSSGYIWDASRGWVGPSGDIVLPSQMPGWNQYIPTLPVTEPEIAPFAAGFDFGGAWPILGIIAIGLLLSLRGGKKGGKSKRRRTRRNPCRRRR